MVEEARNMQKEPDEITEEISIEDIELGNLLFGNSRGRYQLPREKWQDAFQKFLEDAGFGFYGYMEKDEYREYLKEDRETAFRLEPVDTDLDILKKEGRILAKEECNNISAELGEYEICIEYGGSLYGCVITTELSPKDESELDALWDEYDCQNNTMTEEEFKARESEIEKRAVPRMKAYKLVPYAENDVYFNNGTFEVRPYFWGDSQVIAAKDNFIYIPDDVRISWYKYPLRDSYINKKITYQEFKEMLDKCLKSMAREE